MAARKRKIPLPDGRTLDGTEVHVNSAQENFSVYILDDQTTLRLKPVVTEVFRVEGEFDQNGDPVYVVRSQNVLVVSAPEHLRRAE